MDEQGVFEGLGDHEVDFNAWMFWSSADESRKQAQWAYQRRLVDRGVARFADRCFVSELAACYPDELVMGDGSYIAAFAYVTGAVQVGADSTINAYAVVRGDVRIGDGVRIGAHTSVLGFNHSMRPELPVFKQPVVSKGITIGDDVWIGSNVVIVDGVTIGEHSVIGAGAVVTKDVAAWSVMAGNPARRLRDRRDVAVERSGAGGGGVVDDDLAARLASFGRMVREQAPDVLARCWTPGDRGNPGRFLDRPDTGPAVRAWCDAVEIAEVSRFGGPQPRGRQSHRRRAMPGGREAPARDSGLRASPD
jgi:acetyltransferase-like isoleucine patch superfamily enzyme